MFFPSLLLNCGTVRESIQSYIQQTSMRFYLFFQVEDKSTSKRTAYLTSHIDLFYETYSEIRSYPKLSDSRQEIRRLHYCSISSLSLI
jgi:hypothetical protein